MQRPLIFFTMWMSLSQRSVLLNALLPQYWLEMKQENLLIHQLLMVTIYFRLKESAFDLTQLLLLLHLTKRTMKVLSEQWVDRSGMSIGKREQTWDSKQLISTVLQELPHSFKETNYSWLLIIKELSNFGLHELVISLCNLSFQLQWQQ